MPVKKSPDTPSVCSKYCHIIIRKVFISYNFARRLKGSKINTKLKSMSKVLARIARIAIISSFYIGFGFSLLKSILVPCKLSAVFSSKKLDFFSGKMKMKNFPFLEWLFLF